ncbi:MAG TPA: CoA transferase [Stellaceae bacterium]|nr:CoA transferase [Stellaceae bacterium]
MPHSALRALLSLAGVPESAVETCRIVGRAPVLPTRFRIGAAGAAAIAAAAMAANELWAERTHEPRQAIAVDLHHAVAALRSARYLRIDGKPPKEPFDRLSGFYEAEGGRSVFLHCNFPHHRAAALGVLGLRGEVERTAVAAAVRDRDALQLEDAIHAGGGCAAFVRTPAEWAAHPQQSAIASLPLLEIERIGAAPPEPLPPAGDRPLAGVRVLDLTRVLAGPTCARTLAEHGAEVLKISAPHLPHSGEIEIDTGLGKRAAFLDLRDAGDIATLAALIRDGRCDVFSQSYRPGTLAARGFGADALAALRPGIVAVELSAWGRAGPWAARRGFDTIVQCSSGMAMIDGGDKPRLLPVSAIDYVSGYLMAMGAMVALLRRAREGGSWRVRVSLARTGQWIVERGLVDAAALDGLPKELPEDEIKRITMETGSLLGVIRHLRPVAQMSETPPRWSHPPSPLGADPPAWPARGDQLG